VWLCAIFWGLRWYRTIGMRTFFVAVLLLQQRDPYQVEREQLVRETMEKRGIRHSGVLRAMRAVPRHQFLPKSLWKEAYRDYPVAIGHGQTISQPYIVARMTELLAPSSQLRVLEIGTGSGYQAAVLSHVFKEVYTIEIVPALARSAETVLRGLNLKNVHVRLGDGYLGWPEQAPFDRILLTAAPPEVPQALIDQLAPGGRLVAPEGADPNSQYLVIIEKALNGKVTRRSADAVRFVPMVPARP